MAKLTSLSRSVAGARVLITGAGSGMGRATAHVFADEGAMVFLADWNGESLASVAAEIDAVHGSGRCAWKTVDVGVDAQRRELVESAAASMGGIDVLINNAGISRPTSVDMDDRSFSENWDKTLDVNLSAHVHLVRLCLAHLMAAPHGGRVVNIASTEALVATRGLAAYTATKHAVVGLTKSLAVELGRRNVTVNAICPGPILTQMTAVVPDGSEAALGALIVRETGTLGYRVRRTGRVILKRAEIEVGVEGESHLGAVDRDRRDPEVGGVERECVLAARRHLECDPHGPGERRRVEVGAQRDVVAGGQGVTG